MKPIELILNDIIWLRKNRELPNIFDVDMRHLDSLKHYSSVECHIVLYPYSRKVCSSNITFCPFEEYVKDILTQQKSAYVKIPGNFDKCFGLLLGLLIAGIFFWCKPDDLFSIGSIVSIFGAYIIGKELWVDIERFAINISKTWRIRYQEYYYSFRLEKHTTLTHYSRFAKKHRYSKTPLLPEKIDFIEQSNSQTVRLCFNMKDLQSFTDNSGHVLSIHIDPHLVDEFEQDGFMFGVKLSLNTRSFGVMKCLELFQSFHRGTKGALDEHGAWVEDCIFYRRTYLFGRLKMFLKSGLLHQRSIIKYS